MARVPLVSIALALCLATAAPAVLTALFPRRFRDDSARRGLWRLTLPLALGALALEALGRYASPLGGGALRPLIAVERVALYVTVLTALGVSLLRVAALLVPEPDVDVTTPTSPDLSRREALTRGAAVASVAVGGACSVVGLRERHALEVTELEVYIPGLPAALEGYTLLQVTDLHVGVFTGDDELRHVEEVLRRLRGDALVVTGDIMDYSPRHIPEGMRALARLRPLARDGAFAALGNHDHYTGHRRVTEGLRRAGVLPLVNDRVRLGDPTRGLVLAGVDDVMAPRVSPGSRPDLDRALRGVERGEPAVLLAHNPKFFAESRGRVALQLSGHTHGGQVDLGPLTRRLLRHVAGRYEERGSTLFVSRGVGITGPPVRLGARPEVARLGLTGRRRT